MKIRLLVVLILLSFLGVGAVMARDCTVPLAQANPTPRPLYLPLVLKNSGAPSPEWSQHAHDAQHTGYAPSVPPHPWRLRWIWNGVDAGGGVAKVTASGSLPRNVQPVTGSGRVYIAAGTDGVFALSEAAGAQIWRQGNLGDVRSTVAYDADTQSVFVVSSNGRLYKLSASDGAIIGQFNSGQTSTLPLPPAVIGDRVFFSMGNSVYAVDKQTMQAIWTYNAGATVAVPPAYSPSRDIVIVATEPDLYVHAVNNADGTRKWRIRPVHSSRNYSDPTEYRFGWPVIAENAGYVLIKVRLEWDTMWRDWPQSNSGMRQFLTQNPGDQALFVLDLDDGSVPYIAHVGHGGYGDGGYMPMGSQPVVRRLPDGKEVVYIIIRAQNPPHDSRWDSHFGEMVLDSTTVSSLQGGYVRFIRFDWPPGDPNPFLLTDEQPNVTAAGDYLFGAHWEAGFAMRILDRSDARGSFTNPITTQRLSTVVTSQDSGGCAFSPSHYCASGLEGGRAYDFGFYIYYNQGPVYDQYWSEYATWVVSNDNLYFRSCDGAIVALTNGNPQQTAARLNTQHATRNTNDTNGTNWARNTQHATRNTNDTNGTNWARNTQQATRNTNDTNGTNWARNTQQATRNTNDTNGTNWARNTQQATRPTPPAVIPHTAARAWAGHTTTVTGTLRYVFNNGKQVLLGFSDPHQGAFKAIIRQADWDRFDGAPEQMYRVGQQVAVSGTIAWYQGDPAIYVTAPEQIVLPERTR